MIEKERPFTDVHGKCTEQTFKVFNSKRYSFSPRKEQALYLPVLQEKMFS